MPTLKERIENSLVVFFLAALVTGFLAGVGVYQGILKISGRETIASETLQELKDKLKETEARVVALEGDIKSKDGGLMGILSSVWRPFLSGNCTIVVGTFDNEQHKLWEATGLIGTGDALALGRILGVLNSLEAGECKILPSSNFPSDRLEKDNIVLIGGPDANEVTQKFVKKTPLRRIEIGAISFTDLTNGEVYSPKRLATGEGIEDHGVILKAKSPFNPGGYWGRSSDLRFTHSDLFNIWWTRLEKPA